jgi:hypothetical protein
MCTTTKGTYMFLYQIIFYISINQTYLHILAFLVTDHYLGDQVFYVRWDRLLANSLNQLAKLEGQALSRLHDKISASVTENTNS